MSSSGGVHEMGGKLPPRPSGGAKINKVIPSTLEVESERYHNPLVTSSTSDSPPSSLSVTSPPSTAKAAQSSSSKCSDLSHSSVSSLPNHQASFLLKRGRKGGHESGLLLSFLNLFSLEIGMCFLIHCPPFACCIV